MKYDIPVVKKNISIEKLIYQIDRSKYSSAFITEDDDVFIAQISVYKLRRMLLSGTDSHEAASKVLADSEIYLTENDLTKKTILESVLKQMYLEDIEFCPVLNDAKKIVQVYNKNDISDLISRISKEKNREPENGYVKNVLVVGGAGYLGSVLTRELLAKGYFVRILDNFIFGERSLADIRNDPSLEIINGDLRNIETIVSSLQDIDAVILLAAVVGDPASKARPTQTIETNYLAAQALASACQSQQINRFIYASTCSVYGKGDDLLDENSPMNPVSLYARTKIASEKTILDMADGSFSPTILRMSTLYGYSPRMRFDLVVNTMTLKSFSDRKIQVFGGGQWRPLLHVKDAAQAYIKCLETPIDKVAGQIFNVGSGEQNYKIISIAEIIQDSLKEKNVAIDVEKSNIDERDYRVSFDKIEKELGFKMGCSIAGAAKEIYINLEKGMIKNPMAKVYYNHYFDSTEE